MTPSEIIAVVQAFMDGKAIQSRYKNIGVTWETVSRPVWNFAKIEYRVKPEPRVFYAIYRGGDSFPTPIVPVPEPGQSLDDAVEGHRKLGYKVYKFVEEIDDAS